MLPAVVRRVASILGGRETGEEPFLVTVAHSGRSRSRPVARSWSLLTLAGSCRASVAYNRGRKHHPIIGSKIVQAGVNLPGTIYLMATIRSRIQAKRA